jgi:hypothetical protein
MSKKIEDLLVHPIEGYVIQIVHKSDHRRVVAELDLHLSQVGGCQLKRKRDLITMIEDLVYRDRIDD